MFYKRALNILKLIYFTQGLPVRITYINYNKCRNMFPIKRVNLNKYQKHSKCFNSTQVYAINILLYKYLFVDSTIFKYDIILLQKPL